MEFLRAGAAQRRDPRTILPQAKSVLAVAARYPVNPAPRQGGFSSCASGRDYHGVMRHRLHELAAVLAREQGVRQYRVCVDTAPLLEREWACRAGLGWIGRQGQLVNAEHGCCLFLGELLVDVAAESVPAVPNRCGDCRRCEDACPTGAVRGDRTIDARRCISYLTIEHRDAIQADLRPAMGEALFGCDRCTAVCPWNPAGAGQVPEEFRPRPLPAAEACLFMKKDEFQGLFADSAVLRTGIERLQRNAGRPAGLPALRHAADKGVPVVRDHAAWALERLGDGRPPP